MADNTGRRGGRGARGGCGAGDKCHELIGFPDKSTAVACLQHLTNKWKATPKIFCQTLNIKNTSNTRQPNKLLPPLLSV